VAIGVLVLIGLLIAGTLMFWAIYRGTSLTQRFHPLTPEQRQRKRKAYAMMTPIIGGGDRGRCRYRKGRQSRCRGGRDPRPILLVDALLTPWLHYRRDKRKASSP
jgi:hypothetical protein